MKKHMATGLDSFSALFSIPDDRVGDMYAAYPMEADLEIERICTHVWLLPVDHTIHLRALRIPYEEAYGNRS